MPRASGYTKPGNWPRLKAHILRRDAGICYICGLPGADTVDHITPVAEGGTHHVDNLAAAHQQPCHAAKTERERIAGMARRRAQSSRQRTREAHPNSYVV